MDCTEDGACVVTGAITKKNKKTNNINICFFFNKNVQLNLVNVKYLGLEVLI